MNKGKMLQVRLLVGAMEWLEEHPLIVKLFLRPVATAPVLSKRLKVLVRATMGATAFEIHDVNLETGRIGIGGVEEIMTGSKLIDLLHTVLSDRLSEDEKNRTLYEMGRRLCEWEVSQAMEHGRWAPGILIPLIVNGSILDEIQTDPLMARFFQKVMTVMSRLITDEGGWGRLEFDLSSFPLKVILSNSQEARWLGKSEEPVCHFYAGIVAGYARAISGEPLQAREVDCKAMGAPKCVFELVRPSDPVS